MARLKEKYFQDIRPKIMNDFGFKNTHQAPKLVKIVVNIGLGEAIQNIKSIDHALEDLGLITGQKPIVTRAKKSISNFKLREGMPIGCSVTLRREKMWEFFDNLISFTLPSVRDFKGISRKAFDGRGNYSLGIKEQIIFPEIDYDKIDKVKGLNVTFVTSASRDEEGLELLQAFGMPFRK